MINYFGYGSALDLQRMKDILGHSPSGGCGSVLEGYVLCYQDLTQIPAPTREFLTKIWGHTYKAYTIKKGRGVVLGVLWELTEADMVLIKEWECIGKWRDLEAVKIKTHDDEIIEAWVDKAPETAGITGLCDGLNYKPNLNSSKLSKADPGQDEYKIKQIRRELEKLKNIYQN